MIIVCVRLEILQIFPVYSIAPLTCPVCAATTPSYGARMLLITTAFVWVPPTRK